MYAPQSMDSRSPSTQHPAVRDAVDDGFVDRQTQHGGVGCRRPCWVVAQERRLGARAGDQLTGQFVEVGQAYTGSGCRGDGGQGVGDDPAGLSHRGDLGL